MIKQINGEFLVEKAQKTIAGFAITFANPKEALMITSVIKENGFEFCSPTIYN